MTALTAPNVRVAEEAMADGFPAREYLHDFAAACGSAMRATGSLVRDVRLGGELIRLCFAGPALEPLVLPALAHLRTDAPREEPLLRVELWDAASTGVFPPRFPSSGVCAPALGEIRDYDEAGVRVLFHSGVHPKDGRFASLTIFDEAASVARYFVSRADHVPWHERAAPLRAVLHWVLTRHDRLLVHAGAVGRDGCCILLTGRGGSGKSSGAVASALAGLDYLGDDYVLVDLVGAVPIAYSLYATAKLAPATTTLLPDLPGTLGRQDLGDDEKHVIDLCHLLPGGVSTSADIRGIVLPRLRPGGPTRLRRCSPGAALQALAPSTIFQAPRRDGDALGPLAELARRLPCYVLEVGGPPAEVVPVLSRLLSEDSRS